MRFKPSWFVSLVVAGTLSTASTTLVEAQPETRDHRQRRPPPPPPAGDASGPTEAPPSPREERIAARAGFAWIPGRWDWKGKWEWVPGHWERERAGKRWRDGRWEQRDSRWIYVAGEWIDANAAGTVAVAPPPPPPSTTPAPPTVTPPPGGTVVVTPPAGGSITVTPPPGGSVTVTAPPGGWPTSPPPPPRAEKSSTRSGFVWVAGEWDWRNGKWEWVPGHWERERAGKNWRASRWEQRDGRWARIGGDWIDAVPATATMPPGPPPGQPPGVAPPMPPPGPPGHMRPRREWKLERPVVSSFWPIKGKAGSRVVIKGRNFPTTTEVLFGGEPVRGARVKGDSIAFVIPATATTGDIALRVERGRPLPVGMFEVAAAYDPIAEQRRLEEERRREAERMWAERQQQLAKDRAAREAALRQLQAEREATRERRRAERVAALQARWQRAFLSDAETQAELTLHAQRVADLARMRELAEVAANGKLAVRIDIAHRREIHRHEQRMAALEASFKTRGGTP
jgi:hypothetical protein